MASNSATAFGTWCLRARLNPRQYACQRGRQGCGVGAASHRHIGLATAFATDLLRDHIDQITSFDAADLISGHACRELYFRAITSGQNDDGRLELGLQFIHGLAQRFGIGTGKLSCQNRHTADVDGLVQ